MNTRRVEQARRLATKSDEDCWKLAGLAFNAIDVDDEPAGEWCDAVGLSRRAVERMRKAFAVYRGPDATRAPHEGRSFWEHVELAGMSDGEAASLLGEAEEREESVRTTRQRRERTALDDLAGLERAHRVVGRTVVDVRKRELDEEERRKLLAEAKALGVELAVLMLYLDPASVGARSTVEGASV